MRRPVSNGSPVQRGIGNEVWAFVTIFLVLLVLSLAWPLVATILTSLKPADPSHPDREGWVGLANYRDLLLREDEFWNSFRVTLVCILLGLVQCAFALGFAIVLRGLWPERLPYGLMVVFVVPMLVSPTVVGLMGRRFFNDRNGLVTSFLQDLGPMSDKAAPLGDEGGVWICYILLESWRWLPFLFLLMWFCLGLVPKKDRELAAGDGLSKLQYYRYIVAPNLAPALAVIVVFRSLEALRTYDIIHVLTGGGPGTSMFTASIYSNRLAFHSQKIGLASAHLVVLDVVFYLGVFFLFRSLASAQHSIRTGRR